MLGSIIGGLASAAAGLFGQKKEQKAQEKFAKNSIQWKVNDSIAAGIHPLFGLGANTVSYAPSNVGSTLASSLSEMGAGIDRSRAAASEAGPRGVVAKLALERAGLENDLLRAQINSEVRRSIPPHVGPAMPSVGSDLFMGGQRIERDPTTSDSQDFENRYGEPAEWIASPGIAWNDLKHNSKGMGFMDMLRWIDDRTKLWGNSPQRVNRYGKGDRR